MLAAATRIESLVESQPGVARLRPSARRWSNTEYAAHVRDALLTIRDRLVLGLIEEEPSFQSLYRDKRVTWADMPPTLPVPCYRSCMQPPIC